MNNKTVHEHEEIITTAGREYRCLFRREIDRGYRVTCADLPPLLAFGDTLEEARTAAQEEIEAWVGAAEMRTEYIAHFR